MRYFLKKEYCSLVLAIALLADAGFFYLLANALFPQVAMAITGNTRLSHAKTESVNLDASILRPVPKGSLRIAQVDTKEINSFDQIKLKETIDPRKELKIEITEQKYPVIEYGSKKKIIEKEVICDASTEIKRKPIIKSNKQNVINKGKVAPVKNAVTNKQEKIRADLVEKTIQEKTSTEEEKLIDSKKESCKVLRSPVKEGSSIDEDKLNIQSEEKKTVGGLRDKVEESEILKDEIGNQESKIPKEKNELVQKPAVQVFDTSSSGSTYEVITLKKMISSSGMILSSSGGVGSSSGDAGSSLEESVSLKGGIATLGVIDPSVDRGSSSSSSGGALSSGSSSSGGSSSEELLLSSSSSGGEDEELLSSSSSGVVLSSSGFPVDRLIDKRFPDQSDLSIPEVIVNDQKVIFKRQPVFDGEVWLFPLEEIAIKLQDEVKVDLINRVITVIRFKDKSTIKLDVNNGIVTVNNNPFRVLDNYNKIILGQEVQLVPISAITLLHNLSLDRDSEGRVLLKSIYSSLAEVPALIQPRSQKGLSKLSFDYLNSVVSFNDTTTAMLLTRRLQINSGGHNDALGLTSSLVFRGGTGSSPGIFDTGYISYFKTDSPLQVHVGDKTLSAIRSPYLTGVILRGLNVQTGGKLPDSKVIIGAGFLPSNQKILGKVESFLRYGRGVQVTEWSSSPKKNWQFSFGEALYNDTIRNVFIGSQQKGGLLTTSITRAGKHIEGESNLALGYANDVDKSKSQSGTGSDLLIRLKPKEWFNVFAMGSYYSPDFFSLSGNSFYNNRRELNSGFNFNLQKFNFGASASTGNINLQEKKPDKYNILNVFGSSTPFMGGPTFAITYSKNLSQVNPTRQFDILTNPITMEKLPAATLEEILQRRTTEVFRASLMKRFKKVTYNAAYSQIMLDSETNLKLPILGAGQADQINSFDFTTNRTITNKLGLISFTQISNRYRQSNVGFRVGPIFRNKLSFQTQIGAFLPKDGDLSPNYNGNLNYEINKKSSFSLNFNKTISQTQIFGLFKYDFIGKQRGAINSIQEVIRNGKIKGRVYIQSIQPAIESQVKGQLKNIEQGLAKVRINFANHTIVTDKDGFYEIPDVTSGQHKISIDYSDIPAYLAALTNEVLTVNVDKGKDSICDFVLTYYGSIGGKVNIINEKPEWIEEELEPADIRVYLEGTDYEALSDTDGSFSLDDVKPGKYKILLDPEFLPEDLEVVGEPQEIEVHAKEKIKNIILKIQYKGRVEKQKEF